MDPNEGTGVYLSDGVWVSHHDYAEMTGVVATRSIEAIENYPSDLELFRGAGLRVDANYRGATIEDRYFIRNGSRTWRKIGSLNGREYSYSNPQDFIRLVKTNVWEQTEKGRKEGERRARKDTNQDSKRRRAYEKEQDARLEKGGALPTGGVASTGPHITSGFYGVAWNRGAGKWGVIVSRPKVKGMALRKYDATKRVGFYDSVLEAALAFDHANTKTRGKYARTNFPKGSKLHRKGDQEHVMTPDGSKLTTLQADDRRKPAANLPSLN
jgi:hypothetical protein